MIREHKTMPLSVLIFCSAFFASSTFARQVEEWPYERLFKESDLVVIAHVQGWGVTKREWNEKFFDKTRFDGVKTIFGANFSLKGDPPLCIWLNHFTYKEGALRYNDGPGLVAFSKEPVVIDLKSAKNQNGRLKRLRGGLRNISQPEYLLFLKKNKDDTYEPVSGQMDASFSVRAIFSPNNISIR